MTATTKSFTAILDAAIASGKPIDQTLMTAIRDSLQNLNERVGGATYTTNTQNHTHDGVDSAKVQVGSNMLRNGDFESALIGWTATAYTGGSVAASTLDADGTAAVQITSTVLANGGGDILSNEFMVCAGGAAYDWSVINWASVANVSSKLEAVFYDQAQAAISTSVLLSNANAPTTATRSNGVVAAPATARYIKIRCTGGIPSTGSAVGTSYFDAIQLTFSNSQALAGTANLGVIQSGNAGAINGSFEVSTGAGIAYVEYFNSRVTVTGTYRVAFSIANPVGTGNGQIYKNGVAYGTVRTNATGSYVEYTEDLAFVAGDTVQIFAGTNQASQTINLKNFCFRVINAISNHLTPPASLPIGIR